VPTSHDRPPGLPDFKSPPVTEVVLSVQFAALSSFRGVHAGLYWREIRDEYPVVSEQVPIASAFETFGAAPPSSGFQLHLTAPQPARHWFETANGEHLVQLQQDRILHNWRKRSPEMEYPRYEPLRDKFIGEVERLNALVKKEGLGEIRPNQCEVTYINTIASVEGKSPHDHLSHITPLWTGNLSEPFLAALETTGIQTKYVLRKNDVPYGRVYINFIPAFSAADYSPVVQLEVTTRGKPDEESIAAAFVLLDEERAAVVRAFTSVTTPLMHKEWGRADVV